MTNAGFAAGTNEGTGGITLFGFTFTSKILGILIGLAGIGVSGYSANEFVVPLWNEYQQGQQNIETLKVSVQTLEGQVASKGNIAEKIVAATEQNKFVLSLLPSVDNIDTMIRDIQEQIPKTIIIALPPDFSYELAGTLRSFQPAERKDDGQYYTYSFAIGFDGKFEDVMSTIQKIERLKPLLVVKDLRLTKKTIPADAFKFSRPIIPGREKDIIDSLPPLLGADFTLQAFVPKTPEELAAAAATPAQ